MIPLGTTCPKAVIPTSKNSTTVSLRMYYLLSI